MSGMHQPISRDLSVEDIGNTHVLHAIDFEDVALSSEGARLVHRGARAVMRQYMPAADSNKLTPGQAVSLFVDKIFWEEDFRYKPEGGILDDTHIRFFTSKSIQRMYREQGFEVVRHEGITPCKSWKEKVFIRLTLGKLKDARWKRFATVARKI